jgi:protein-S-isoprenylcysteine O-methyltransferase Ste14
MHKILVFVAFGWLTLGGTMHFVIDVLSQYLRAKRVPGPETTLFFGLNTAFALGQILFGVLGLLVARQAPDVLSQWPAITLSIVAALCWLAFTLVFLDYWEPKFAAAVFTVLVIAAAATA